MAKTLLKVLIKVILGFTTYSSGTINDIQFVDTNIGFAALGDGEYYNSEGFHSGKILKTTDGGSSWSANYHSSFIGFNALEILNTNTIICSGSQGDVDGKVTQGYIVKTTTQGN